MLNPKRFVGLARRGSGTGRDFIIILRLIVIIVIDGVGFINSAHGRFRLLSNYAVGTGRLPVAIIGRRVKVLARCDFV